MARLSDKIYVSNDDKKKFEELDRKYLANKLTPEEKAKYEECIDYNAFCREVLEESDVLHVLPRYAKFSLQKHMNRLEELVKLVSVIAYRDDLKDYFTRILRSLRKEHKYIRILVNAADEGDCVVLERALAVAQSCVNLIDCEKEK